MRSDVETRLESSNPRRSLALLVLGLVAGLGLTAAGVLGEGAVLPDGAVAAVNGRPIARSTYERVIAGLEGDKREGVTSEDRRHVLDRLIEEELLIQRAFDLGVVREDLRLRGELARTMIAAAVAQAGIAEPTHEQLERFFGENAAAFSGPDRLRIGRIFVAAEPVRSRGEAEQRARSAAERLRVGEAFESVAAALGDPAPVELPEALLTPQELRGYLGPTAARAAAQLGAGGLSEPLRSASGFEILRVDGAESATAPVLAEVEDLVRAEWKRREEERALHEYLDGLRAAAKVTVASIP